MEYAEDGDAEPVVEQVLEASATIPNIPVPSSSDGNVSYSHFFLFLVTMYSNRFD